MYRLQSSCPHLKMSVNIVIVREFMSIVLVQLCVCVCVCVCVCAWGVGEGGASVCMHV